MFGIRKGLATLGVVSLLAAGGAVATASAALAWDVGATASADCSSKGTVVINGSFTNKESDASGDMSVTMKWGSKSDGPTRVDHKQMQLFTIDTGESSVSAGSVTYLQTWVDRAGSDQKTVAFSAKSCSQPEPESKKVFVCKYVGTPGTDERLQTGNNPISVSWKQGDRVPGTWFNDKHDRSYVLAWDTGQPEPDVSQCLAPEGPPPVTKVNVPASPATVDPCNPQGVTDNVAWKNPLPADTDQVNWSESSNHNTRTASLKGENVEWSDGTKAPKVFTLPDDSGVVCVTPPNEVTVPTVPVVDECGVGNAHYGDVPSGNYTVVRNEDGSITLTAKDGYVFTNGNKSVTLPKPEETNTAACPVFAPKASISTECEVLDGVKSGTTVVNVTLDNTGSNVAVNYEVVVTVDGVAKFYTIPVDAATVHIPQLYFSPKDGKTVSIVINALDVTQATLSFETATCAATVTPPPTTTTKVTAVNGHFADKCGTKYNLTFTPAVTKGVMYVQARKGNTLMVRAVAQKGYKLTNPLWTQSKTDKLVACPVSMVHKPPVTHKPPVVHKPSTAKPPVVHRSPVVHRPSTTTKSPVTHKPPTANPPSRGIGASTGLDDTTQPSGLGGLHGILLVVFLMGLVVLNVFRIRTLPATEATSRHRQR